MSLVSPQANIVPHNYEIVSLKISNKPKHTAPFGTVLTEKNLLTDPATLRAQHGGDASRHKLRPFEEAPLSSLSAAETIDLDSIDFSEYVEGPKGLPARQRLAAKLEKCISTYGFFNITNHGFPKAKLDYLRSIAQAVLEIPEDEKLQYLAGARQTDLEQRGVSLGGERGIGFKPRGYWAMQHGVRDAIEHYNFRDVLHDDYFFDPQRRYPQVTRDYLPEIAEYFRFLHYDVLRKLCTLCDLVLEKPEGFLWENFYRAYSNDLLRSGAGYGRFMHYLGMTPEEEQKTEKTWLRGHSDATGFTFITSQPILSLQIRDYYTGQWKYVGHRPNSLIVNIGDAMEFITGGYFKSSIHRVVAPPQDQKKYKRLVLIYFSCPSLTAVLDPEAVASPKLDRLGYTKPAEWEKITFAQWDEEKPRLFGGKNVNFVEGDEPTIVKLFGRDHERWHLEGK